MIDLWVSTKCRTGVKHLSFFVLANKRTEWRFFTTKLLLTELPRGPHLKLFLFPIKVVLLTGRFGKKSKRRRKSSPEMGHWCNSLDEKIYTDLVAIVHIFIMEIKHLKFGSHFYSIL